MSWTQQDTSFKKLQNKRITTSTGKGINEEKGASTLELYLPDIKTDLIPGIPPGTTTSVLSYTGAIGQTLVVDTSVPGNLTWFATSGYGNTTLANDGSQSSEEARLMGWISDKYDAFGTVSGAGYEIKVYDKNNNLITKTDPSDWLFDYQTGILAFNNASTSYGTVATSGPFRVVGYRYIGNKGIITGAYGGLGFTTYNFGDILVGAGSTFIKLPLGSNNYILSVSTSSATGLSWVANSGGGGAGTVYNGSLNAIPYYPAAGTAITGSINFTNTGTGISIAYSTASLSTTTGALTVAGGVGIGGSLYTSSSYANSISGVVLSNGVITSGSWAGSTITGLYGGTGYTSYTKGDILVGAGNTFVKFGVGTNNYVLGASSASGSGLTWRTASSATATTSIAPSNPLSGDIWYDSSDGSLSVYYDDGNTSQWVEVAGAFTGTVGLGYTYSIPYYDVTGIGITGSTSFQNVGTGISILYAANSISTATGALVVSGGVGIGGSIYTSPSNAASISGVVLSNNIITSGSWAGSTITARYGGTGYTTYTTGDILVGSGSTFIKLGVGSSGQYLISDPASSSGIAWTTLSVAATGITGINGLTATTQFFATGTTGIGFNISSSGSTHTFNIPIAGTGVTGLITGTAQTIAGQKTFTSSIIGDLTGTATTATYALQSGFSITSGLATTSNYALQSGYALTSGLATTASYAYQSGYAITSGLATTATYSNQSGYAITSGFATTSNNVNVVNSTSNTTHSLLFSPGSGTLSGAALSSNSTVSYNPSTFVLSTPGLAVTSSTASTSYNTGALVVAGGVGIGGSLYVNGDLTINGTTTTINSVTLTVDDKNIELGSVSSPSDVTAEAGGITLKGTSDKFINWYTGTGWSSNQDWNLASGLVYKINNTSVLSASSLGTGVTNSSLTAVGTITTGTWAGSLIAGLYGGTGYSSYTKGDILVGAGSTFIKLAVGTDNFVLTADATTASGVKWSSVAGLSITSVNGLTASAQFFSTGSSGTGFNISSSGSTHTFNIPIAGTGATGLVSTLAQSFAGTKTFTGDVIVSSTTGSTAYNTGSLTVYGGLGVSGQLSFNQAALGYTGATNPSIAFIGSTTAAPITLTVLSDNSLLWEGTSGKLFGINNNLSSGWIFNVGDISGLPIIRANADGTIAMAEFAANVGIGLSNPSYKLHVVGDTNLSSGYVYRINGTSVLSATSLGTGVTNSSLTAVGTLTTGTWAATAITALYGGTGLVPSFTVGDILYANTSSTWGRLAANSNSGYVLTSAGSGATPTYVAPSTLSVGFATTAGFATTSSYAYQSGYAITSGLATTATYSHQSGYAITSGFATTAGLATTATYAHQSGYAITSGFATSSTSASIATTSTNINVVSATTSASHRVLFTPATATASGAAVSTESSFVYNPSTDILSVSGLAVTSGTASTNSNTGALVVTGGVGIGGTVYTATDLNVGNSTTGRLFFSQATLGSAGTTVIPTMAFIGATNSPITLSVLADNSLSFDGSSGQLFSINNNLSTGWIFAVNDISGLPLLRANADGTVAMGEFAGNIGIGLSNPSYKLHVAGDTNLSSGNVYRINGTSVLSSTSLGTGVTNSSLTALGTITTGTWAGSTITARYGGTGYTTYTTGDILVGAGSTFVKVGSGSTNYVLSSSSIYPAGVGWTWVSAVGVGTNPPSNTHDSDLWWNATDGTLNLYYNDGDSSQWVEISGGNGIDLSQPVHITSSAASTNVYTGALIVDGGVGIQGQLHTSSLVINGTYEVVAIDVTLATAASNQVIHTLDAATFRSVKYMVQITHGTDYQIQEILLLHDSIDTYLTQYAQLLSGNNIVLATYDADLSGGNMRLLVSPTYTNTTFKIYGTAVRI